MLKPTLGLNLAGSYVRMPQNLSGTDDGTAFDTTTAQVDDTLF